MAGTFVVGMLVGLVAWWMFPIRGGMSLLVALAAGALGAALAFYGGRATHLFVDGQIMAWAAIIVGAVLMVGVAAAFHKRRG